MKDLYHLNPICGVALVDSFLLGQPVMLISVCICWFSVNLISWTCFFFFFFPLFIIITLKKNNAMSSVYTIICMSGSSNESYFSAGDGNLEVEMLMLQFSAL